jgi:molybdenum cofactor cytidylyltransferase
MTNRVTGGYGAILLAAGLSSRFARGDKLLHPWRGRALLSWTAEILIAVPLTHRIAVIGPHDDAKRQMLEAASFVCVVNPQPVDGMGSSLASGARALPDNLTGVFVVLGDMPAICAEIFGRLREALEADPSLTVVAPTYQEQRGHPVLFRALHLPALRALSGNEGARAVLQSAVATTRLIPVERDGVLRDFDTEEAFERVHPEDAT